MKLGVTDHRIGLTVHQPDLAMEGAIDEFIDLPVALPPNRKPAETKLL